MLHNNGGQRKEEVPAQHVQCPWLECWHWGEKKQCGGNTAQYFTEDKITGRKQLTIGTF